MTCSNNDGSLVTMIAIVANINIVFAIQLK